MTSLNVDKAHSYLWHVLTLYEKGVLAIAKTVANIANGIAPESVAQKRGGAYYSFPEYQDLQAFERKGFTLVDGQELFEFFKSRYLG